MSTKNLGQVAGLWIGNSAPTNTTLIWFDNTPAIRCHKVYDEALGAWKVLSPNTISSITYSELRNLAQGTGLTQGSWYKITDRSNALALAITTTKVQYTDANGNFIIDDLASSSVYVVTSSNLLIDDIRGAWDAVNKRLEFNFTETAQDENSGNDFLFGKKQRAGIWSFAKYKLSQLVSSVTGNSISWNRGIFFNFNSAINSQKNVAGGVVGKDAYDTDMADMQQSIDNVSSAVQSAIATAKSYTDSEVTATKIYNKQLPTVPTAGTATDIAQNDALTLIITKIQRWIWQLKAGDGIQVTSSGMVDPEEGTIWPTDTIFTAIKKLLYKVTHIGTTDIVDDAVTTAKLADNAVTPDKIYHDAVTTDKILDSAVTTDKIANNAVTENKIGSEAVSTNKIATRAVTGVKIALNTIDSELLEDKNKPVLISGWQTYDTVDTDIICTQLLTKTTTHWTVPVIEVRERITFTIRRGDSSLNLNLYPYSFFVLVKLIGASDNAADLIIDNSFSGLRIKAGGSGTAETKYCRVIFIRDTNTSHYYAATAEEINGWLKNPII